MRTSSLVRVPVMVVLLCLPYSSSAQTSQGQSTQPSGDANLAKQLANPIESLVSVPLQFNCDQPVGVDHDTRSTINFQPVE